MPSNAHPGDLLERIGGGSVIATGCALGDALSWFAFWLRTTGGNVELAAFAHGDALQLMVAVCDRFYRCGITGSAQLLPGAAPQALRMAVAGLAGDRRALQDGDRALLPIAEYLPGQALFRLQRKLCKHDGSTAVHGLVIEHDTARIRVRFCLGSGSCEQVAATDWFETAASGMPPR